jgi:hypothetical protein
MRRSEVTEEFEPSWSDQTFGDDVLVWIDADKINASWSKDGDFYFDHADHPNAIAGRIPRFDEWLKQGQPIRAPELCLNAAGDVFFTNGRHRFVWMRQHGIRHMPVAVPANQAIEFERRFN